MKTIALPRLGAWLALAFFLIALLLANLGVPEYSHLLHPVALRGATGLPGAVWFNLGAFVLPGGLLLLQAQVVVDRVCTRRAIAGVGPAAALLACGDECGGRRVGAAAGSASPRWGVGGAGAAIGICTVVCLVAAGQLLPYLYFSFNAKIVAASRKVIAFDTIIGHECRKMP